MQCPIHIRPTTEIDDRRLSMRHALPQSAMMMNIRAYFMTILFQL